MTEQPTPIEIPRTLSDKLAQLGPKRYVRLAPRTKNPIDKGWQKNPRTLDDPKLVEHLAKGGNYGVVCGMGLTVVDLDSQAVRDRFGPALPETFTVLTPGHDGLHLYYISSIEKKIILKGATKDENVGQIQGENAQVVGPGSIHPDNGKPYMILRDLPLAQIKKEELLKVFRDYTVPEAPTVEEGQGKTSESKINIRIEKVIDLSKLVQRGDEFVGEHPVHGSETGHNFSVNVKENVWHCWRHETGAGSLEWLVVEAKLIACEDMKKGVLRGDLFKQALQIAVNKGLVKPEDITISGPHVIYTPTVVTDTFIAEEVWDRTTGPPKYIRYTFSTDQFDMVQELDLGEKDSRGRAIIYQPVDNDMMRNGVVILPTNIKPCTLAEVLKAADDFVARCYDPREQGDMVKLLTRIAIGSHFLDRFSSDPKTDIAGAGKFAPIVAIRGKSGSGKNRLLFCLRMLSYRPYYEFKTSRIPSLYRPMDIWRGTLCLDEADFYWSSENSEVAQYFNSRTQGTPITRQNPKNPKITNTFYNFGATFLTQRRAWDDDATGNRTIPHYSLKTHKQLPTVETLEWRRLGLNLQNMLLYLRLKLYKKVEIDNAAWIEGVRDFRLIASMLPLIALAKVEPSIMEDVKATIQKVAEIKIRVNSASKDGIVINYFWDRASQGLVDQWNGNYYFKTTVKNKRQDDEGKWHEEEKETVLTTHLMHNDLGWTDRDIYKIIDSLTLLGPEGLKLPRQIRVPDEKRPTRVIFFQPERFEESLYDFVVGYREGELYKAIDYSLSQTKVDKYTGRGVTTSKCGTSGTSGTGTPEDVPPVPDVPDVPHKGVHSPPPQEPTPETKELGSAENSATEQDGPSDLDRLEAYIRENPSVGFTRVCQDLGFSSIELRELCKHCDLVELKHDLSEHATVEYKKPKYPDSTPSGLKTAFMPLPEGDLPICEKYRGPEENRVVVAHCLTCGDKAVYVFSADVKIDLIKCRAGPHQGVREDRLLNVIKPKKGEKHDK